MSFIGEQRQPLEPIAALSVEDSLRVEPVWKNVGAKTSFTNSLFNIYVCVCMCAYIIIKKKKKHANSLDKAQSEQDIRFRLFAMNANVAMYMLVCLF